MSSRIWLFVSMIATITACSAKRNDASALNVTNGRSIAESEYPAVVKINLGSSYCTSSFISPRVLLTAAHCVHNKSFPSGITALMHPLYLPSGQANRADLAVIAFDEDRSADVVAISPSPAEAGDPIRIVGYGRIDAAGNAMNTGKHVGENKLGARQQGLLVFSGVVRGDTADGINSASASGDSGGPMFVGDKLVGVTSAGSIKGDTKFSIYVDLHSQDSKDFFRQVLAAGIEVPLPAGYLPEPE